LEFAGCSLIVLAGLPVWLHF